MSKTLTVFNVHPVEAYWKNRAREKVNTLIDRSPRPIRKLGKGERGICFSKKVVTDFSNADATAGIYVQGLKSATEVAYTSCAYLSFRTVIPGGGGTPWNS